MNRYLIHMSYLGTQFRGAQKQVPKAFPDQLDRETIQGNLEIGLRRLRPLNKPFVVLSSRTDTGVHALHSTCHVDLESKSGKPFDSILILSTLNSYFNRCHLDIRILNVVPVNNRFHARHDAIKRTYLYRIAVTQSTSSLSPLIAFTPVEERRRCHFVTTPLDINHIKEAASLFVGKHDFRTFMETSKSHDKITRKNIDSFEILPGNSHIIQSATEFQPRSIQDYTKYTYWDFVCTARSFLHKQIRRMVGVLLSVGQGKLTYRDVKFMLQIPSKHSWDTRAVPAPPHGLYLCKVEYRPESLHNNKLEQ